MLDNAVRGCFCEIAADGESFMVVFMVLGEGGVGGGVVSRGRCDGRTMDGEDGATMASLYQCAVAQVYIQSNLAYIPRTHLGSYLDLVRGSRWLLQPRPLLCHVPSSSLHKADGDSRWREHRAMNLADEGEELRGCGERMLCPRPWVIPNPS